MSQIIESEKQSTAVNPETIQCVWCGKRSHVIKVHLDKGECASVPEKFASLTPAEQFEQYKAQNPDAPTISQLALKTLEERRIASEKANKEPAVTMNYAKPEYKVEKMEAHTLFGVPLVKLCRANGAPLMVTVNTTTPFPDLVPKKKEGYVFGDTEILKDVIMMLEMGIPGFIWGHMGTGKSTIVAQVCAYLNRPMIRSQHTASTEESHIVGQILAKEGSTYFEPGLLSLAMRLGWVYLADEYDFAYPQILGIYQPVLEGEPLTLKEATPEWRTVEPHEKFAFVGTGNTNGSGDETGLYQGTNIQNAANFSRFGIVTEAKYMESRHEVEMIMNLGIEKTTAQNLVSFAKSIRESFAAGKISQPIGPRELTLAAIVGSARSDLKLGIEKAFINKLPSVSAQVAREIAQRYFA